MAVAVKKKARAPSPRVIETEQEFIEVLHELYQFYNDNTFDGKLPGAVITLSGPMGGKLPGRFAPAKWRQRGSRSMTDEISLHPEVALKRSWPEIAAVLAHQMAHQAQERFPTIYGTPSDRVTFDDSYHPREWHDLMSRGFGLEMPEDRHTGTGRFGTAKLTRLFRERLAEFPGTPETWTVRAADTTPRQKNKYRLWVCKCNTKIRSAVLIDVTCNVCGRKFRQAD